MTPVTSGMCSFESWGGHWVESSIALCCALSQFQGSRSTGWRVEVLLPSEGVLVGAWSPRGAVGRGSTPGLVANDNGLAVEACGEDRDL